MKSLIALLITTVIIGATVLAVYKVQQIKQSSIEVQPYISSSTTSTKSTTSTTTTTVQSNTSVENNSVVVVKNVTNVTLPPGEGIYLLKNSSGVIYIVYSHPITRLKIFNYTFVIAGPISTFNGILELQNMTLYQELENQKEMTLQIYNGTSWDEITLDVNYIAQSLQPYAFLVPSGKIEPF